MAEPQHQDENLITPEEVKSIIKDCTQTVLDEEENMQYDHTKSLHWINRINETCLDGLTKLRKPYKFIISVMIMRKTGAGMHICSSAYWGQQDNSIIEAYDASKHIYAVINVHWIAV
jgi:hypothetical protein